MGSFQIDRNEDIYWSRWCWMFLKIFVLYSSLFWKHWNRGYIPVKEFNRNQEVYIRFNFYFNPSILLNIYKTLCQQGPQFSYVLLRIVFLFWVLYTLTPNNNTLCPLLLDCGKQQLIISFSLSLHNMWFSENWLYTHGPCHLSWKPRIFSLFPVSLHSCHSDFPD